MVPQHEFILLTEERGDYSKYMSYVASGHGIAIEDGALRYISDSLQWIQTLNPAMPEQAAGHGLNYHGVTVINKFGADKASRIFRHWAELFAEGPEQLELTGDYSWVEEESISSGCYERLAFARREIVEKLGTLANYAEAAAGGEFYILHLGI